MTHHRTINETQREPLSDEHLQLLLRTRSEPSMTAEEARERTERRIAERRAKLEQDRAARPPIPDTLVEVLVRNRSKQADRPKRLADMSADERRAYDRQRRRQSRQRIAAKQDAGEFGSDGETVRTLLADAAIAMLRDGGPARDALIARLGEAYDGRAGHLMRIEQRVRAGKLSEKLLKSS